MLEKEIPTSLNDSDNTPRKTPSNNPLKGASYLLGSLPLMMQPGIKHFVFIPLFINIAFFSVALYLGISYFDSFMAKWLDFSHLWEWLATILNYIKPLLWLVFLSVYLIIVFYSFSVFANIIAAPFNSLLAEATEAYLLGKKNESSSSISQILKDILPIIWSEINKLMYFLLRALPILVLFIIPLTTAIAPFLWFAFNAWMMSLQYMDYPMGNHRLSFKQQKQLQQKQRFFSLGFGSSVLVATMIPVVNFLIIPVAVIASTKIWLEHYKGKVALQNNA